MPGAPGTYSSIVATVNDGLIDSERSGGTWEVYEVDPDILEKIVDGEMTSVTNFTPTPALSPEKTSEGNYEIDVPLKINFAKNIGSVFQLPNEQTYDKFLGIDFSSKNKSSSKNFFDFRGTRLGYEFKSGNNKLKAGLFLNAGYNLGGLAASGGVDINLQYEPSSKTISVSADPTEDISLDFSLPYAYLKAGALADINFEPSLIGRGRIAPIKTPKIKTWFGDIPSYTITREVKGETPNILKPINFKYNKTWDWIDFDTRAITGSSLSKEFKLGPVNANVKLPEFGRAQKQSSVADAISSHPKWKPAGEAYAWGISGTDNLFDIDLSVGELITNLTGIPLKFNSSFSFAKASVSAGMTLLDAKLGVGAEFVHDLNFAIAPSIDIELEGGSSISSTLGDSFNASNFRDLDTNKDDYIDVTVSYDPIIGFNALARVATNFNAEVSALESSASFKGFGRSGSASFGPLMKRNFPSKKINFDFVNEVEVFTASELGVTVPSQTISLPISIFEEAPLSLAPTDQEPQSVVSIDDAKRLLALLGS